jgi:hypothetical protein
MTKTEAQRRNAVNKELHALIRNKFFEAVPVGKILDIVEKHGFEHWRHGDFIGFYIGATGRRVDMISSRTSLVIEWYKMPSGRYEVNTYVS